MTAERERFETYTMNSLLRHSFAIAGVVGLVVLAVVVAALRPKHACGAGAAALPEVMVAQVEEKDVAFTPNGSARWRAR